MSDEVKHFENITDVYFVVQTKELYFISHDAFSSMGQVYWIILK